MRRKKMDNKMLFAAANRKIQSLRERYLIYRSRMKTCGFQASEVEIAYKKMMSDALSEVSELMKKLLNQGYSQNKPAIEKIRSEFRECFNLIESCLDSLEIYREMGQPVHGENVLTIEMRNFKTGFENPHIEIRKIVGLPLDLLKNNQRA